jgi:hypothetical protein
MKNQRLLIPTLLFAFTLLLHSCSRRTGCPSNGKNVGAERFLSGEKIPKARKFKS